jgi:hypothetical protein
MPDKTPLAGAVTPASIQDSETKPRAEGEAVREGSACGIMPEPADAVPVTDPSVAVQLAIDRLLGTEVPEDWHDPEMVAVRTATLERAAVVAGEGMVELLARLRDERARSVHLAEGGCVLTSVDGLIALHRALVHYQHEVPQRRDGLFRAHAAIEADLGAGIADLTLASLGRLRGELDRMIRTDRQTRLAAGAGLSARR